MSTGTAVGEVVIGSLFSGYGGLDLGVMSVLGGRVAWHVESAAAPSRILAHHWPDVPNHGDITLIDWTTVEPIDILTGGFPCQDVSLAGARAGIREGTRSGLWSEFARAIEALQPRLVVIENVRGLLSASAGGPVESDPWGVGDGATRPVVNALGAVLGDLADLGFDAEWVGVRAADAGAPHGRFRVFVIAHPAGNPWRFGDGDDVRAWSVEDGRAPTAGRSDPADPASARRAEGEDAGAGRRDASSGSWGVESERGGRERTEVQDADRATGGERWIAASRQAEGGRARADVGGRGRTLAADSDDEGCERIGWLESEQRDVDGRDRENVAWGAYEPAIRRWEAVTGRDAPAPTVGGRLSPVFVEWMMGLPAGHVTDVGLKRAEQLKALGNGVVPQQAALALTVLLARVPGWFREQFEHAVHGRCLLLEDGSVVTGLAVI